MRERPIVRARERLSARATGRRVVGDDEKIPLPAKGSNTCSRNTEFRLRALGVGFDEVFNLADYPNSEPHAGKPCGDGYRVGHRAPSMCARRGFLLRCRCTLHCHVTGERSAPLEVGRFLVVGVSNESGPATRRESTVMCDF